MLDQSAALRVITLLRIPFRPGHPAAELGLRDGEIRPEIVTQKSSHFGRDVGGQEVLAGSLCPSVKVMSGTGCHFLFLSSHSVFCLYQALLSSLVSYRHASHWLLSPLNRWISSYSLTTDGFAPFQLFSSILIGPNLKILFDHPCV